jgi:hypothetical protein
MAGETIVVLDPKRKQGSSSIPSITLSLPDMSTTTTDWSTLLAENDNPNGLMVPGGKRNNNNQAVTPKLSSDDVAKILDIFSD